MPHEPITRLSPQAIDQKWQQYWQQHGTFVTDKQSPKPKYYVLDMFPYPSGAGLHVGHPLGYIATDILGRFKRLKGFNVLHPMGFDAFGLPAEQYAIQTGQHPAKTTAQNIARFKEQMAMLGLAHDPTTELRTSDPKFYKWTQWIFLQLFNSWYDYDAGKARPIKELEAYLAQYGNAGLNAACDDNTTYVDPDSYLRNSEAFRQEVLMHYRLAYISYDQVNWCPALGTVLSNDEVKDGLSERGGHPVEKRTMRQWSMRIIAFADRLLEGLERIDWPESIKEQQRHWIGRSEGARVTFEVDGHEGQIEVFTTRPDTIFGTTFMVLAPEHALVEQITTDAQRAEVEAYVQAASAKSDRDRMAEGKQVSGVFTGGYALHPFTGEQLPIWIADYVLAGYGTGAVMAVPGHDERDWRFASHFGLEMKEVVAGGDITQGAHVSKTDKIVNSDLLNGLPVPQAISKAIEQLEAKGAGRGTIQYRLRDAIFARQRYWGEPIPIVFDEHGTAIPLDESELPLQLPEVESYTPTGTGESPLAAVTDWVNRPDGTTRETNTMPGWAGSSWYFMRYPDSENDEAFADPDKLKYWLPVDFYLGGSEHAVGHLLYCRFWTKALYDLGHISFDEPMKKLVNQGMIQGRSSLIYKRKDSNVFTSAELIDGEEDYITLHVDVSMVQNDMLDVDAFKQWRSEYANAEFRQKNSGFRCISEVEKMSKSKYNVVTPDELVAQHGADVFRMYEMFLGPIEQHKPWSTDGITGVAGFIRKFWRLFYDDAGSWLVTDEPPTKGELKALHQTLKKVEEDCEALSFNTSVSQFMIATNELTKLGCHKRAILQPLCIALSPFAPHISEELWQALGHEGSISQASYPAWSEDYLKEDEVEYPVQINGKVRFKLSVDASLDKAAIEALVLAQEETTKYTEGKPPKKVIVVPGRIVNVVV